MADKLLLQQLLLSVTGIERDLKIPEMAVFQASGRVNETTQSQLTTAYEQARAANSPTLVPAIQRRSPYQSTYIRKAIPQADES